MVGMASPILGILPLFKKSQNFPSPQFKGKLWPFLMANNKELAESNCRSHAHQVEVKVKCMKTTFGGHGFSKFSFEPWTIVYKVKK